MRFNVCVNEIGLFGPFKVSIKGCIKFYSCGRNRNHPTRRDGQPQGMKVFAVERHRLPEDFVSFRALCGVQSSPLVFAPNRALVCGLFQG